MADGSVTIDINVGNNQVKTSFESLNDQINKISSSPIDKVQKSLDSTSSAALKAGSGTKEFATQADNVKTTAIDKLKSGVIGASAEIYTGTQKVKNFVTEVKNVVETPFVKVHSAITTVASGIVGATTKTADFVKGMANAVAKSSAISELGSGIKNIGSAFSDAAGKTVTFAQGIATAVSKSTAMTTLENGVKNVGTYFSNAAADTVGFAKGVANSVMQSDAMQTLSSGVQSVGNAFSTGMNRATAFASSINKVINNSNNLSNVQSGVQSVEVAFNTAIGRAGLFVTQMKNVIMTSTPVLKVKEAVGNVADGFAAAATRTKSFVEQLEAAIAKSAAISKIKAVIDNLATGFGTVSDKTKDFVDQVKDSITESDSFKKVSNAVDDVSDNLEEASSHTSKFVSAIKNAITSGTAFDKVKTSVKNVSSSMSDAASKASSFASKVKSSVAQSSAVSKLKTGFSDLGISVKDTGEGVSNLGTKIKGVANTGLTKVKDSLNSFKTSVLEAANGSKKLQDNVKDVDNQSLTKIDDSMKKVEDSAKSASKGASLFGTILKSNLVSTAIMTGVSDLTNGIKSAMTAGSALAETAEQNNTVWSNLGVSAKDVQSLGDQVDDLRSKTALSEADVNSMQKSFYSLTGSAKSAETLTNGVAALGDKMRLSDTATAGLGTTFAKVMQSGTLTTATLEKLNKTAPGIGSALASASGMSIASFDKMVAAGKLTTSQLQGLLGKVSANSASSFKSFQNSASGAQTSLKGSWEDIEEELGKPLVSVKTTGFAALATALRSSGVQDFFKTLGTFAANGAKLAVSALTVLANHMDILNAGFKIIGTIINGVVKTVKTAWSDLIKGLPSIDIGKKVNSGTITKALATANKYIGSFFKGLSKYASGITPIVKAIVKGISNLAGPVGKSLAYLAGVIGTIFKALGKLEAPIINITKVIAKAGFNVLTTFLKNLVKYLKPVETQIKDIATMLIKYLQPVIDYIAKWIKTNTPLLTTLAKVLGSTLGEAIEAVVIAIKILVEAVIGIVATFKSTFKNIAVLLTALVRTFKDAFALIKSVLAVFIDIFTGNWKKLGSDLGSIWKNAWNVVKDLAVDAWDVLKTGISAFASVFKLLWTGISDLFKAVWSGIKTVAKDSWEWLSSGLIGAIKIIAKGWENIWDAIADKFKGVWDTIKKYGKDGINAVIGILNTGIGGIDDIIHDFGGSKTAIKKIKKLAHGTQGADKGLAMVNDGGGQEAIIDNSGNTHLLKGKNQLVNFEGGETVIPYEATKKLLGANNISHYASGTDNWLTSAIGWLSDKWTGLVDIIKNPVSALGKVMSKAINGMLGGASNIVGSLAPAMGTGLVKGIESPILKLLKTLKSNHDDETSNPVGTSVKRWTDDVKKALKANGLSDSTAMVNKVLRQISTESGGNPNAVQHGYTDANTLSGDLAKGLMQVISSTFNAYKFSGHDNIFNGYDNLLAALAYAKNRYGSSLSYLGEGHGYANGGEVTSPELAMIGEGGYPEFVLSTDPSKSATTKKLLQEFLAQTNMTPETTINNNVSSSGQSVGDSNATSTVNNSFSFHFDKLIWNNAQDIRKTSQALATSNLRQTRGNLA